MGSPFATASACSFTRSMVESLVLLKSRKGGMFGNSWLSLATSVDFRSIQSLMVPYVQDFMPMWWNFNNGSR